MEVFIMRVVTEDDILAFAEALRRNERSRATVEKYTRDTVTFMKYCKGRQVNGDTIRDYRMHLRERYAISSVNSMVTSLNAFFKFKGWHDIRVKQLKMQQDAYCRDEKDLSRQEYQRLIEAAEAAKKHRLSLIIQTVCGTGIRISELRFITYEAAKKGEALVNCKGKVRHVFIIKALRSLLMKYAKKNGIKSGPIFITRKGNPVDRSNIWRDMKTVCKAAHVSPQKVFPHNLRHLFAKTFYDIDKDIARLADVLGHSNINTTRIYTVTSVKEHGKKMERMKLVM